jgi:putative ABC transport system ATP-binding protein
VSDCNLSVNRINVTLGEGETRVNILSDVSLEFPAGMVTLIMGPSGSGKTTLLSVLGCLLQPQGGNVILNGQDVTALTEEERTWIRREHIGFIFQSFRLFNALTAVENVMLAMQISGNRGPSVQSEAERRLDALGMTGKKHLKPADLSGGEKQRVAIARALMREPKIILADEPTASLDSKTGETITKILHDIAEVQQRTVVIVSHDERLRVFSRNIIGLRDGQVAGRLN